METIRAYTTIEQSRKLAEILPLESADMYYFLDPTPAGNIYHLTVQRVDVGVKNFPQYNEGDIPCWSLAALLNYLKSKNKFPEIKELSDGGFKLITYIWDCKDCIQVSIGDTIVDSCVELILKLNELKML